MCFSIADVTSDHQLAGVCSRCGVTCFIPNVSLWGECQLTLHVLVWGFGSAQRSRGGRGWMCLQVAPVALVSVLVCFASVELLAAFMPIGPSHELWVHFHFFLIPLCRSEGLVCFFTGSRSGNSFYGAVLLSTTSSQVRSWIFAKKRPKKSFSKQIQNLENMMFYLVIGIKNPANQTSRTRLGEISQNEF